MFQIRSESQVRLKMWPRDSGWFLIVFATYIFVAYLMGYSKTNPASSAALNFSVAILDAVAVALIISFARLRSKIQRIRPIHWLLIAIMGAAFFLHVDYFNARLNWTEYGWIGPVSSIKEYAFLVMFIADIALLKITTSLMDRYSDNESSGDIQALKNPRATKILEIIPLLMLVAAPLIHYVTVNSDAVSPVDSLVYIGLFWGIPSLSAIALSFGTVRLRLPTWLPLVVLGLFFCHYQLPLLRAAMKTSAGQSFWVPTALAFFVPAILAAFSRLDRKTVTILAGFYLIISSVGSITAKINNPTQPTALNSDSKSDDGALAEENPLSLMTAIQKPDVILLAYDGYPNPASIRDQNINNESQIAFLKNEGFEIYPEAYSLFFSTLGSISRLMDMNAAPRHPLAGPNKVLTTLNGIGYDTNLVLHPYFFQETPAIGAKHIFPPADQLSQLQTLIRGTLGGEFRHELVFNAYDRSDWVRAKRDVIAKQSDKPLFLYAHSGLPGHSQISGSCLPDEKTIFEKNLAEANKEMREDIALALATRKDAIIIVASDHGPRLTGDCLYLADRPTDAVLARDLRDRYGVMLAIKWPQPERKPAPPELLQDTFFAVFEYLTGDRKFADARLTKKTIGYGPTIKDGAIIDGRIAIGSDRGKHLIQAN